MKPVHALTLFLTAAYLVLPVSPVLAQGGLGLGAKALLGGGAKNIGLQPLALETRTGLGASGGLSFLYIEPAAE